MSSIAIRAPRHGPFLTAVLALAAAAISLGEALADGLREELAKGIRLLATVYTIAGVAVINNRIIQAGTAPKNIGWGTGSTGATTADTTLVTEAAPTTAGGRTVGSESRTTVTNTNDNYAVTGSVVFGSSITIQEAGIFDATSAGNMPIRSVFTGVAGVSGDSIAFTFGLKQVPG